MKALVTCFHPFRGRANNGSQALAHFLENRLPNTDLRVIEMPVQWGAVEAIACPAIDEWSPDLLLGIGEGGPDAVVIETVGHNVRRGEDVDGTPPPSETILESGEEERRSRFSFAWDSRTALAVPIHLGLDAGAYLCNHCLYTTCVWAAGQQDAALAGFVHLLPATGSSDASPGMPIERSIEVVGWLLDSVATHIAALTPGPQREEQA